MQWIQNFSIFLFDFDGLLVDTETVHFAAYKEMCHRRGFTLPWTLSQFFEAAHFKSTGLQEQILALFPPLKEIPWSVLYAEKKKIYEQFLEQGELQLMPGVEVFLKALASQGKKRCVVTNSARVQVEAIQKKLPVLSTIPLWITRECYKEAKPSPECYKLALSQLKEKGDRVVGFEDSMRGLKALCGSGVDLAVLVCHPDHPQMRLSLPEGAVHVPSLG